MFADLASASRRERIILYLKVTDRTLHCHLTRTINPKKEVFRSKLMAFYFGGSIFCSLAPDTPKFV